ncbi:response regulator transcription factor [Chromobacterium fluminis]|nr:response regulator transcription factor [Chromobacterium haemolyticum]
MAAGRAGMSAPRPERATALIVDDQPENLALLHDALDSAGYRVLLATDGAAALRRAAECRPDIILLDAVMPGMDGFETARRLKAEAETQAIPIVFMTGLSDSEHVLAAFAAGGADYVVKPLRPAEVLARLAAHIGSARQLCRARQALEASGQALLAADPASGRPLWLTERARGLLQAHGWSDAALAARWRPWLGQAEAGESLALEGGDGSGLLARRLAGDECLLALSERGEAAAPQRLMRALGLTPRQAEVLHWLSLGKTNRDIGDILGMSPRTVNKHLEHVFARLGVETRTSAAALALRSADGG